jgi:hypothetical protein
LARQIASIAGGEAPAAASVPVIVAVTNIHVASWQLLAKGLRPLIRYPPSATRACMGG